MESETQPKPAHNQSFETQIGLYWLHKLGIVSLVFGIVFLILCSFASFTPLLKLLSGFSVASALLVLGHKMAHKEKSRWFAHGLTAAGWSLAYFTTYAAHYVPAVCVIPSLPIETCLLVAVAACSMGSALQARAQWMSIYSVSLASLSILLSGPSLMSNISFLIIAATTAVLGNLLSWRKLFAFGMAACYWGHFACGASAHNPSDYKIGSAFLASMWLVFTVGLGYAVQATEKARKFVAVLSCANAAVLAGGLALPRWTFLPMETSEALLIAAGAVNLAISKWLHNRGESQLSIVNSLLGLSLINVAKSTHFTSQTILAVDIMQIAVLGTIGAKMNIRAFRWFAMALTALLIPAWAKGALFASDSEMGLTTLSFARLGMYAAATLGALAALHIRNFDSLALPKKYKYFYLFATNTMVTLTTLTIIDPSWRALALVAQTIVNAFIADRLDDIDYLVQAPLCALLAAAILLMERHWNTTAIGFIVMSLYSAYAFNRYNLQRTNSKISKMLHSVYAHAANIMLTLFIFKQLSSAYVSPGLAVEGIGLLSIGFLLRDSLFRFSGLTILAILTTKLFLIDFAQFDTIERVGAFIAAGVVFLLSSYGYAQFTRSFEDEPSDEMQQNDPTDPNPLASGANF